MVTEALKACHLFFLKHSEMGGKRKSAAKRTQRLHLCCFECLTLDSLRWSGTQQETPWRQKRKKKEEEDSDFREDSEANLGESKTRPSVIPLSYPRIDEPETSRGRPRKKTTRTDGMGSFTPKIHGSLFNKEVPLNKCSEKDGSIENPAAH